MTILSDIDLEIKRWRRTYGTSDRTRPFLHLGVSAYLAYVSQVHKVPKASLRRYRGLDIVRDCTIKGFYLKR